MTGRVEVTVSDDRQAQVWACLRGVTDPELDEPVTELNFVTRAEVDSTNRVHVEFRLPTYWCAANFAFMMADDMRRAVAGLDWVREVTVVLGEHMYADVINRGIAERQSFQEAFGAEATGDLDEVRRTFLLKAFQGRQRALLSHLVAARHDPQVLVALTMADLAALPLDEEGWKLRTRYAERRSVVPPAGAAAPAFVSAEGCPLSANGFEAYMRALRRVCVNAEFNGALCRGLLAARFDLTPADGPPR
jgi:metal-sulfur cluster biosynthetic enzyme